MNTWVRRSLSAGALTASALLVGGGVAHADIDTTSTDSVGLLNGTQLALPVQAPINVCGIAASVGGAAGAECDGGAAATLDEWSFANLHSGDNLGLGNGTQLQAPVQAPVNVCGIGAGVLGTGAAACDGGSRAEQDEEPEDPPGYGAPAEPGYEFPDQYEYEPDPYVGPYESVTGSGLLAQAEQAGAGLLSLGNVGLLNGTQAVAPVQLPINVCGVAVGVLGPATADCGGGASADLGL